MMETTVIKVKKETREMLKSLGRKGESYDDIIRRLIEAWRRSTE
jgi:predicted CopG family antitoxin